MKSPHRQDLESFERELLQALKRGRCLLCDRIMQLATVYVSVHATEFGNTCAGQGRCYPYLIPYCPNCELQPKEKGCIHVPMFAGLIGGA